MNGWTATLDALKATAALPTVLEVLQVGLGGADKTPPPFQAVLEAARRRAARSESVLSNPEALIYPLLVGSWSVVEAAIEDLIVLLLLEDPQAIEKVVAAQVKLPTDKPAGTESFARATLDRMRSMVAAKRSRLRKSVVQTDVALLAVFGVRLEYAPEHSEVIEEINAVRNCILHRMGTIDQRAVNSAPRLSVHLGKRIPATDPIFTIAGTMIYDYTTAWLKALAYSPYLRDALKPELRKEIEDAERRIKREREAKTGRPPVDA